MSLDPPAYLNAEHRAIWHDYRQELLAAGRTATTSPDRLAELVSVTAQHRRATQLLAGSDIMINRGDGVPVENPTRAIQRDAAKRMRDLRRELGLNRQPPTQPVTPQQPGRWCDEHRRWECVARRRNGDAHCHGPAITGLDKCRMHAGRRAADSPVHILAVERRANPLAGEPMDISPGEALLWRVRKLAGEVRDLDAKVASISEDDLVWGEIESVTSDGEGGEVHRTTEGARLNMWLQLRAQRERQLQSNCEAALRAGVEAALVELARDQVQFMHRVIAVALLRFAQIPEDDPRVAAELPGIIMEIAG